MRNWLRATIPLPQSRRAAQSLRHCSTRLRVPVQRQRRAVHQLAHSNRIAVVDVKSTATLRLPLQARRVQQLWSMDYEYCSCESVAMRPRTEVAATETQRDRLSEIPPPQPAPGSIQPNSAFHSGPQSSTTDRSDRTLPR